MRLFRPGLLSRLAFPGAVFRIGNTKKSLYLTFDDGPDPWSTPGLIEILDRYKIKALFFCNGRNAEKYPCLIGALRAGGHMVGNHGYEHLNGWLTGTRKYLEDVSAASEFTSSSWFRPPYGRISFSQYNQLKKIYKIFFWDLMPYDFDTQFDNEKPLEVLKKKIRPGSVIVLHDAPGSSCISFLSPFIEYAYAEGYVFCLPHDSPEK